MNSNALWYTKGHKKWIELWPILFCGIIEDFINEAIVVKVLRRTST